MFIFVEALQGPTPYQLNWDGDFVEGSLVSEDDYLAMGLNPVGLPPTQAQGISYGLKLHEFWPSKTQIRERNFICATIKSEHVTDRKLVFKQDFPTGKVKPIIDGEEIDLELLRFYTDYWIPQGRLGYTPATVESKLAKTPAEEKYAVDMLVSDLAERDRLLPESDQNESQRDRKLKEIAKSCMTIDKWVTGLGLPEECLDTKNITLSPDQILSRIRDIESLHNVKHARITKEGVIAIKTNTLFVEVEGTKRLIGDLQIILDPVNGIVRVHYISNHGLRISDEKLTQYLGTGLIVDFEPSTLESEPEDYVPEHESTWLYLGQSTLNFYKALAANDWSRAINILLKHITYHRPGEPESHGLTQLKRIDDGRNPETSTGGSSEDIHSDIEDAEKEETDDLPEA